MSEEKSLDSPLFIDRKAYRSMAFVKLRLMTEYVQKTHLPFIGAYRQLKIYFDHKYDISGVKTHPDLTKDEEILISKEKMKYDTQKITIQKQEGYRTIDIPHMHVIKRHVGKGSWVLNKHIDDEYIIMARAICFYLLSIAFEDNIFTSYSQSVFVDFRQEYQGDWTTVNKRELNNLIKFDLELTKDCLPTKKFPKQKDALDLKKKVYVDKNVAMGLFRLLKVSYFGEKDDNYKQDILAYKELCRNVVEFMIRLMLIENNIIPSQEYVVCPREELQVKCGGKYKSEIEAHVNSIVADKKKNASRFHPYNPKKQDLDAIAHEFEALLPPEYLKLIPNYVFEQVMFQRAAIGSYCEPDTEMFKLFYQGLDDGKIEGKAAKKQVEVDETVEEEQEDQLEDFDFSAIEEWFCKEDFVQYYKKTTGKIPAYEKIGVKFFTNATGLDGNRYMQDIIMGDIFEMVYYDSNQDFNVGSSLGVRIV